MPYTVSLSPTYGQPPVVALPRNRPSPPVIFFSILISSLFLGLQSHQSHNINKPTFTSVKPEGSKIRLRRAASSRPVRSSLQRAFFISSAVPEFIPIFIGTPFTYYTVKMYDISFRTTIIQFFVILAKFVVLENR